MAGRYLGFSVDLLTTWVLFNCSKEPVLLDSILNADSKMEVYCVDFFSDGRKIKYCLF